MRPIKLTMQAFGAYQDKMIIPFEKLISSNVFLITGDTGSGKTTIFDAISYALFDSPSGSIRPSNSLRSHFADSKVESFVELEFLYKGQIYKVSRMPSYERKKTRGEGVVIEQSRAQIVLPSGRVIIKPKEVNEFIVELLGVDGAQFRQIALIAQGEFLNLLNAPTPQRAEIFRNIFKTGIFVDFQTNLKNKAFEYKNQFDDCEVSIFQYISQIEAQNDKVRILQETILNSKTVILQDELLDELYNQNKKTAKIVKKLNSELKQKEMENDINLALKSQFEGKTKLLSEKNEVIKKLKTRKAEFEFAKKQHLTLEIKQKEVEELIVKIEKTKNEYDKSLEIKRVEKLIKEKELCSKKNETEIENFKKLLSENKKLHAGQVLYDYEKLKNNLSALHKICIDLKKQYDTDNFNYEKYYNNYITSQAGILAQNLKDNIPCPVCGSIVHPEPAVLNFEFVDKKTLDNKKQELEKLREKLNLSAANCNIENEKIKAKEKEYLKLCAFYSFSKDEIVKNKEQKDYEKEIENIKNDIELCNRQISNINSDLKALRREIETYKKDLSNSNSDIDLILKNHKDLKESLKNKQQIIKSIKENYDTLNIELNKYKSNLDFIEKQLLNYKDIRENEIDNLNEKIDKCNNEREKLKKEISLNSSTLLMNEKIYEKLREKIESFIEIQKLYSNYKTLSDCANGTLKGKKRLTFEGYIQGYYLDMVLIEANKRLKLMSNSRFQLIRKKDDFSLNLKTGLDLEVMDFYTYKKRSTKTLSGGESFYAALSLALGLSDVAGQLSGNIDIGAIFIDEGFGSLDNDSIELAMDVIMNLSYDRRLVGIISHVESLKNYVENTITARKTPNGSYIELSFGSRVN